MSAPDSVIQKVQKLLRLTESPNEHEAALAAERAQELMLRYGIELAQLHQRQGGPVGVGCEHRYGVKLDPWRRELAAAIAASMGGRMVFANEPRKWTGELWFYAQKDMLPGILALYDYLEAQALAISAIEANRHVQEHGKFPTAARSMKWRRSFLAGIVRRVGARLLERKERIEEQADTSMALVVVKDAVDEATERAHSGSLVKDNTRRRVDSVAYAKGQAAGDEVDLGDARLKEQGAIGAGA